MAHAVNKCTLRLKMILAADGLRHIRTKKVVQGKALKVLQVAPHSRRMPAFDRLAEQASRAAPQPRPQDPIQQNVIAQGRTGRPTTSSPRVPDTFELGRFSVGIIRL